MQRISAGKCMPIKEAQDASCASLACPCKGNAGCGGWHKDNTAFPAWGRQRGGGFAAKKKANPASLRSAAPSKGRGSRGHSLLPMEGGAPKGRRLDGESGMKKSGKDRLKCAACESTLSTAARSPFPNGEGYDTGIPLFSHRQSEYTHMWRKRITTDKAFPSRGRWRAERAG